MFIPLLFVSLFFSSALAVVGGKPETPAPPFIVSLQSSGWFGASHVCGGTIIGPRTILTAAHCVDGSSASSLVVAYGGVDRTKLQYKNQVTQVIKHPNWNTNTIDCDYAILRLTNDVVEQGFIVAEMPTALAKNGDSVSITGWGQTGFLPTLPEALQAGTMSAVDSEDCNNQWKDKNFVTTNMACSTSPTVSACSGDNGGPVLDETGKTILGVISWGTSDIKVVDGLSVSLCSSQPRPNVYADVFAQRDWIESNIQ